MVTKVKQSRYTMELNTLRRLSEWRARKYNRNLQAYEWIR